MCRFGGKDNLPSEKISLGLDLQGGVHLLLEVEAEKAVENTLERYAEDLEEILFEERIPFDHVNKISATEIEIGIIDPASKDKVESIISARFKVMKQKGKPVEENDIIKYVLEIDEQEAEYISRLAIDQAIETIRNRIDEFGVSEPIILKQGTDKILIQLPGVDDPDRAIDLIGKTAILEFKLVDDENSLDEARKGNISADSQLLYQRQVDPKTSEVKKTPVFIKEENPVNR